MGMPTENRNTEWGLTATELATSVMAGVMERKTPTGVVPARTIFRNFQSGAKLRGNFTMRCNHCREWNAEEEHRCRRCGRRLMSAGGFEADFASRRFPVTLGAAAPKYATMANATERVDCESGPLAVAQRPESIIHAVDPQMTSLTNRQHAVQSTLFGRGEGMKVVSIAPEVPASPVKRDAVKRNPSTRNLESSLLQQQFEFAPPQRPSRRHADTTIEAVIYCTDPVASITHRTLATAADLALVAIAVGLFAIAFSLAGGEILFNRQTALVYGAIPAIIALFYKFLWAIAGADSPGMRWARLRTVNFDGKKPELIQRFVRLSAAGLGLAAVGIGFLWAFVDEETLTWHDHISNTFVTHI